MIDVSGAPSWWEGEWHNVVFDHARWTPEVHQWFLKKSGKFRYVPLHGTSDCVYMFADKGDAVAFRLTFPELCRSQA